MEEWEGKKYSPCHHTIHNQVNVIYNKVLLIRKKKKDLTIGSLSLLHFWLNNRDNTHTRKKTFGVWQKKYEQTLI